MMLMLLSSCTTGGSVRVIDTACSWVRPVYLTRAEIDALSQTTQRAILMNNENWDRKCRQEKA